MRISSPYRIAEGRRPSTSLTFFTRESRLRPSGRREMRTTASAGRITLAAHHACLQGARAEIQDKLAVRQALAGKPQELAQR